MSGLDGTGRSDDATGSDNATGSGDAPPSGETPVPEGAAPAGDEPASGSGTRPGGTSSPEEPGDADVPWKRLSPLIMVITLFWGVVGTLGLSSVAHRVPTFWLIVLIAIAVIVGLGYPFLYWHRTTYRVTPERLEVRSGIFFRKYKSIPRDRIRSVDLHADLMRRIVGTTAAKIETGEQARGSWSSSGLALDPLRKSDAEWLRVELLRQPPGRAARDASRAGAPGVPDATAASGLAGGSDASGGPDATAARGVPDTLDAPGAPGGLPGVGGAPEGAATDAAESGPPGASPPVGAADGDPTATPGSAPTATGRAAGETASMELARLHWPWLRYAPLGLLTPALGLAAIGAVVQVADWFNQPPWEVAPVRAVVEAFLGALLPLGILLFLVAFLLVGAIGAIAVWIETWWNYRLEHGSGVFRVRRGLLTSRSISFEEARLRGIELTEPLTLRPLGVGQPSVVATGMESQSGQQQGGTVRKTLMPPATMPDVHPVTARVLGEDASPLESTRLVPHPKAALRRRLIWCLGGVTLPVVALVVLGLLLTDVLLWLALAAALVGYAAAAPLAVDAYRNLGHGLRGRFLLARRGAVVRRTVALQRSGVIGWKIRQSFFQRRAGIATVTATTAAGNGYYDVYDAELGEGLEWADEAVPDLLTPFLVRSE